LIADRVVAWLSDRYARRRAGEPAALRPFREAYYFGYGPAPAINRTYERNAQRYRDLYYHLHAEVDAAMSNDKLPPTVQLLEKLAAALEISVRELFPVERRPKRRRR